MGRRYRIISGDGHVETPPDVWVKYVPEAYHNRAPRLIPLPEGGEAWLIEGQPLLPNGQNITAGGRVRFSGGSYYHADGRPAEGAGDGAQRLREQDKDGIDAEVLFPPVFASRFVEGIRDRKVYGSMIRAYNTFLAQDYCSVAPDRLIGNATIPVSGIDDAVAELEHAAGLGLRSVAFHQFPNGSGQALPEDDRFWARSLELGLALSPHFGFGDQAPPRPGSAATGTAGMTFAGALCQRTGTQPPTYCVAQLIASGVFDRFPEIRFYFAETNASWLPWCLFVLDDNYELFRDWYGVKLAMKPSEYVARHCWFGIIRDPLALELRDRIPIDHLMWGSDFPHSVGSFPDSRRFLDAAFAGVDPALKRKILLETPAAYFGLDLEADITETPAA